MAQSVIQKKEEKVTSVFEAMLDKASLEEFKIKFKEMYPRDWDRIVSRYKEHERRDIKQKGHPMPEPEQYLKNMYNVYKGRV